MAAQAKAGRGQALDQEGGALAMLQDRSQQLAPKGQGKEGVVTAKDIAGVISRKMVEDSCPHQTLKIKSQSVFNGTPDTKSS